MSSSRKKLREQEVPTDEEHLAAAKIQAAYRGKRVRVLKKKGLIGLNRSRSKVGTIDMDRAARLGDAVVGLLEDEIERTRGTPLRMLAEQKTKQKTIPYGALRFPGGQGLPAKWAAVPMATPDINMVSELLKDTWQLKHPKVIISVTGAAAGNIPDLSKKQREIFVTGLSNAMTLTDAWAVSGGTNSGVMKLVGQTAADAEKSGRTRVCLGIATWGVVKNHEDLGAKVGRVHRYTPETPPHIAELRKGPRAPLDPLHTHFILVDAGESAVGQFGKEIKMRAALEDALCRPAADGRAARDRDNDGLQTLMVLVVVAGGPGTLTTVQEVLSKQRPVVVHATSGGAAGDIYRFVQLGILPTNDLAFGDKDYDLREKYVSQTCTEALPAIQAMGARQAGFKNRPLLTFFGADDHKEGRPPDAHFDNFLLDVVRCSCAAPLDAIMHATLWGSAGPPIVQSELAESATKLDAVSLSGALKHALLEAAQENSVPSRECVELLMNFNADGRCLALSDLFQHKISRYPLHLADYAKKMLQTSNKRARETGTKEGALFRALKAIGLAQQTPAATETSNAMHLAMSELFGFVSSVAKKKKKKKRAARYLARFRKKTDAKKGIKSGRLTIASTRSTLPTNGNPADEHARAAMQHSHCAFGFFVLENVIGISGYKEHLRTRALTNSGADPNWFDLMMWAVITGNQPLARILWLRTSEPIRAALIAKRVCLRLQKSSGAAFTVELDEAAESYEEWAVGVLDQIAKSDDAVDHLTLVPARILEGKWQPMWRASVLDEAMKSPYPCRNFLSHRHCQHVHDLYFTGNYRGSEAAVAPNTGFFSLLVQSLLHIVGLDAVFSLFEVYEPNFLAVGDMIDTSIEMKEKSKSEISWNKSKSKSLRDLVSSVSSASSASASSPEASGAQPSAEIAPPPPPASPPVHGEAAPSKDPAAVPASPGLPRNSTDGKLPLQDLWGGLQRLGKNISDMTPRLSAPESPRGRSPVPTAAFEFDDEELDEDYFLEEKRQSMVGNEEASGLFERVRLALRHWLAIYKIPKVRFCMHATVRSIMTALLAVWLVGGLDGEHGEQTIAAFTAEWLFWAYCVGRFIEELEQMNDLGTEYLQSFWNVLDTLLTITNLTAFVLRMWMYYYVIHDTENVPHHLLGLKQQQTNFQSLGLILLTLRYIELLTYIRSVGEVWVIFVDMCAGTWAVVLVMLIFAAAFGFAFEASFHANHQYPDPTQPFMAPWSYTMWAAVGLLEPFQMYEHFNEAQNRYNWLPVLLYVYVFLTTIFLVNLMIAKMTSTYSKIETYSTSYRAQQKVELALAFKNAKAPPPLNVLDWLVALITSRLLCLESRYKKRSSTLDLDKLAKESEFIGYMALMGRNTTMRLQTREKRYMQAFDKQEKHKSEQEMKSRVEQLQAHMATFNEMLRESAQSRETQ